jgi:antirestriction protein ArdC
MNVVRLTMEAKVMVSKRDGELLAMLGSQVEQLKTSEGWVRWLEVAARFHDYSVRNQLLILFQRPAATRVAGYRAWQSMGRQVREGERGIAVMAPSFRQEPLSDGSEVVRTLVGFRPVFVFDVDQTDGEELPIPTMPSVICPEDLDRALLSAIEASGIGIDVVPTSANGARGWWDPTAHRITIVDSYSASSRARTLLHELSHAVDVGPADERSADDRRIRELVAESSAWLVGQHLHIDMGDASALYLASWGGGVDAMVGLASRVLDTATVVRSIVSSHVARSDGQSWAA